ncbi:MAG TPA: PQQ-dependent sugar dehydrogenase [Gemmatimonadales bacterium]|jgi:glucose/arabinose dehydrogenase|nr:PQQ-dependent sugar dehydrogenase [Gemmatimonadales bacterium]
MPTPQSVHFRRVAVAAIALLTSSALGAQRPPAGQRGVVCEADNGGLDLPSGFCARTFASNLGPVRQLVVTPDGVLYAALSGSAGDGTGGVLAYRDRDGDGTPDERASFGPGGGNDVKLHDGYLYFARNTSIVRWRLTPGKLEPDARMETVVSGLPAGGHGAKSVIFLGDTMLVNFGSASNSCQQTDRLPASPGKDPCPELAERAGIWAFAANRTGQTAADGRRWATGLRNAMALAIEPRTGLLYAGVHGMDQLRQSWGFSNEVNANNPAELFAQVQPGQNYGWPYCYFSNQYNRMVTAPEYGGDGSRSERCTGVSRPAIAFPGHWAPMAIAFYTDTAFGPAYRGGAFMAWHGSWNRAPLPQEGYRVVFIPFRDGRPEGTYQTFAIGRDGPTALRATGVAVAPDGSLYISADQNGKIWRVVHR